MSQRNEISTGTAVRAAPAGATANAPIDSIKLESQGQRRRAQLVRVAAMLIERDGVDNLRMAGVAKAAGCARQVVHTYFARREDLLRAVLVEFDTVLQQKLGDLDALVMDTSTFGPAELEAWGRRVAGAAWDLVESEGPAGLMLMVSSHVNPVITEQGAQLRQPFVERWMSYVEGILPAKIDAEIMVELWLTVFSRLVLKWRAGEITRDEGISHMIRYNSSILQGLAKPAQETR